MKIALLKKSLIYDDLEGFIKRHYNDLVDQLNAFLDKITLEDNFSADIKQVEIANGVELAIPHGLKVTPKYRIILRQRGNSLITDGDTTWTDKLIYLKNNGANDVTLTVMILRS